MGIDYSLNINFNFHNGKELDSINNWSSSYLAKSIDFNVEDVNTVANNFNNSFFKLDYYDTPFSKSQKVYLTTILQASNGIKIDGVTIPTYLLDYTENTEGFFVYWLKDKEIFNFDTFYVSATFFNGQTGSIKRMSNRCQAELPTNDKYNLNEVFDFYYKLNLNYGTHTYEYYDINNGSQIGVKKNPMNWFEYITKK
jgi:hypothetical protein